MCIIIDANVSHEIKKRSSDARPVVTWLEEGPGSVVIGGLNAEELSADHAMRRWLRGLLQAGRARSIRRDVVEAETEIVTALGLCSSNDAHVGALARVSGARLLFSRDRKLQADFGNRRLLSKPRGKVYQRPEHTRLLAAAECKS